jgi:precorrin-6B methylase 2
MNNSDLHLRAKVLTKEVLRSMYKVPVLRPLFSTVTVGANAMKRMHQIAQEPARFQESNRLLGLISSELVVRNGLFKGMKYPDARSAGSSLLPKIVGSYESELAPIFERIVSREYSDVIDIGCAEGYYAIGLAIRFPNALCYAFDTSADARSMCERMARLNGVDSRVVLGQFCDPAALCAIPIRSRALVISDCEGYEKTLFTPDVFQHLANHDILIEAHDMLDIEITPELIARAAKTHSVTVVDSIDDIQKVRTYQFPEIEELDAKTKLSILREGRAAIMQWLFFEPLASNQSSTL